jgi:hypothetical protein
VSRKNYNIKGYVVVNGKSLLEAPMLINCSHCSARVNGEVQRVFHVDERNENGNVVGGYRVSLLKCPACEKPIVGWEELLEFVEGEFGDIDRPLWSDAKRVWPNPESSLDASIPKTVRVSLDEARGCLSGGNYTASVVMSVDGR